MFSQSITTEAVLHRWVRQDHVRVTEHAQSIQAEGLDAQLVLQWEAFGVEALWDGQEEAADVLRQTGVGVVWRETDRGQRMVLHLNAFIHFDWIQPLLIFSRNLAFKSCIDAHTTVQTFKQSPFHIFPRPHPPHSKILHSPPLSLLPSLSSVHLLFAS